MNDEALNDLVQSMLQSSSIDVVDTYKIYQQQQVVTPLSDIISDMEKIESDVQKNKYWTERQYNFLKKCCNVNLRQYNIKVHAGRDGIYDFAEVVFENVLPDSLRIIGKCTNYADMAFTITSEGFKENQYEIPLWVKHLMKQVFENYKAVKNLEK